MNNLAFHNDATVKASVAAQVLAHEKADEIAQGVYFEDKGRVQACFIGCVAHNSDVFKFEKMTGFPPLLTHIGEAIFEGLVLDKAKSFPSRVIQAARVGADLSLVPWKFLHWLIETTLERQGTPALRDGYKAAVELLAEAATGKPIDESAAAEAKASAWAAWAAWETACYTEMAEKYVKLIEAAPMPA